MSKGWGWWKTTVGDFEEEAHGTVGLFGRHEDVQVSFEGEEPMVDGREIVFPALDPSLELDYDTLGVFRGWMDTESATLRYSDHDFLTKEVNKARAGGDETAINLLKTIEAVRTEKFYMDEYFGASRNLVALAREALDTGLSTDENGELPKKEDVLPNIIGLMARQDYSGAFVGTQLRKIADFLGAEMEEVREFVEEIRDLESTQDSLKLAQKIYKWADAKPNPAAKKFSMSALVALSADKAVKEAKKKRQSYSWYNNWVTAEDEGPPPPYRVLTTKWDRFHHWSDPIPSRAQWNEAENPHRWFGGKYMRDLANLAEYKASGEKLAAQIAVTRRKIELMVAAKRKIDWEYQKQAGKLDAKRLVAAYQGNPNAFKVRDDRSDLDTVVSVVVDMSGSMDGSDKRKVAFETVMVVSECLNKIGIPFEIIGFNTMEAFPNTAEEEEYFVMCMDEKVERLQPGRMDPIHLYGFKTFKDRLFDARRYMWGIQSGLTGGANADAESIWSAYQRLRARPEKKKLMFVMSDGQPSCEAFHDRSQQQRLKEVVSEIEAQGAEIVGVGILSGSVESYYTRHVVCKKVEDLAPAMLDSLKRALLPEKVKKEAQNEDESQEAA